MAAAIKPPTFAGKTDEDADTFIKAFDRFIAFKEVTDGQKQLNLLAVLMKESAGDWFESLRDAQKDTIAHLREAFAARYQTPEALKYRSASEIFTRKQADEESVDDYIMRMRKLAKVIGADDNILRFAIINGLKPYISIQVTQAKPTTIDAILDVARLAELTMPRAMSVSDNSATVNKQLADLTATVQLLAVQMNKATTSTIQPRSPTPERRVRFDEVVQPMYEQQRPPRSNERRSTPNPTYQPMGQRGGNTNRAGPPPQPWYTPRGQSNASSYESADQACPRCARKHTRQAFCPAMDPSKVCNFCGKQFHFQAACFSAARQRQMQPRY